MRFSLIHLQLVDEPLLDGVLSSCIGGHAEALGSLPQLLLLLLTVRVGCGTLRRQSEFAKESFSNSRPDEAGEIEMLSHTKESVNLGCLHHLSSGISQQLGSR